MDPPEPASDALRDAMRRGAAPIASAAMLARRGDREALRCLAFAASFASPSELDALRDTDDPAVSDALAAAAFASSNAPALRETCAALLEGATVTPASLAALTELAEGPRRPPWSQARRALDAMVARSTTAQRDAAERIRQLARQLRAGEGGASRRIAALRDIGRGEVHPLAALLVDPELLCSVVAPIDDALAETLVPMALTLARTAQEPLRGKALALIQRRWGAVAALPLSCAARASTRPKDEGLRVALVASLASLGAFDALAACAAVCAGASRGAALAALERSLSRAQSEAGAQTLLDALADASDDADPAVAARALALTARLTA